MKKYLRLGVIPSNEKSVNWRQLTLEQRKDLREAIEVYGETPEKAIKSLLYTHSWSGLTLNDLFEAGVSVFELNENDEPILSNEKLIKSYEIRKDEERHIVTGDVVGTGEDGEPLLINIKEVE